MDRPKFKMAVEEMISFNDDCEEAIFQCPQRNHGYFEDRDIFRKEVSPKQLLSTWKADSTLWKSGYHQALSEDALDLFRQYELYKAKKKIWKAEQKAERDREFERKYFS